MPMSLPMPIIITGTVTASRDLNEIRMAGGSSQKELRQPSFYWRNPIISWLAPVLDARLGKNCEKAEEFFVELNAEANLFIEVFWRICVNFMNSVQNYEFARLASNEFLFNFHLDRVQIVFANVRLQLR